MNRKVVVICKHILEDPTCAKCAFKTESADCSDSGWQFLCGEKNHSTEDARIVSVEEVMQMIPSSISILESSEPAQFLFDGETWVRSDGNV